MDSNRVGGTSTDFEEAKYILTELKNGAYDEDSDEVFEVLGGYCARIEDEMLQEICKEYGIETAMLEPSVQNGRGAMFLMATGCDAGRYDFQEWTKTEREYLRRANTEEEYKAVVKNWINRLVDNLEPYDDLYDTDDDEE